MTLADNLSAVFVARIFNVSILMFNLLTAVLQPPSLFAACLWLLPYSLCFPHRTIPIHAINSNSHKSKDKSEIPLFSRWGSKTILIMGKPLLQTNQNYSNLIFQNIKKYFDVLNGFDHNHGLICVFPRPIFFRLSPYIPRSWFRLTSKKTPVSEIKMEGI